VTNLAPVPTLQSREVAPGVKIDSSMTAQQRFEIIKNAGVVPEQFHTNSNATTFANGEKKGAPASTTKLPASAPSTGDPVADFDAEMRAKGLQRVDTPPAQTGPVEVDEKALAALNELYRGYSPAERERYREAYQRDLITVYGGRKLGEKLADFEARKAGTSAVPFNDPEAQRRHDERVARWDAAHPKSQYTAQQWEDGHKSVTDAQGWIPFDRVNKAGLSGYQLPKWIENQTVHRSVFTQLADARAAGLTQEQVTAYLAAQMRRDGHIK
jgi:hypothetical protein